MWFVAALFALLAAASLIIHYAEPGVKRFVLVIVGFSWALGFSYFLFLPFDIENGLCRMCISRADDPQKHHPERPPCQCLPSPGIESLDMMIPIAYGITMLLGYLMNDFIREFISSGEFTRKGRVKDALHAAAYFYVPAIIIGLALILYIQFTTGVGFLEVRLIARGAALLHWPSAR